LSEGSEAVDFHVDLAAHEATRLAAVLSGCEGTYDPAQVLLDESEAHRLLYSNLDAEQQKIYDGLVAAGVLGA
jgi:hypothetical protein